MTDQDLIDKISAHCNEIVRRDEEMLKWRFQVVQNELEHIAGIGASIVLHKAGIRNGGGFVAAAVSNSLVDTALRADTVMQKVLAYMATFVEQADSIYNQYRA